MTPAQKGRLVATIGAPLLLVHFVSQADVAARSADHLVHAARICIAAAR